MTEKRSPGRLQQIPPENIDRNPENPRLIFRQEEMDSLMVSIDTHGVQVPLTVYREAEGYRLIDGEDLDRIVSDRVQGCVQRCCLARPRWSGDEDDAVGLGDQVLHAHQRLIR